MTLHQVEWLMVIGAVALAAAARRFEVSPWRILGLASIATAVVVGLATHISAEQCTVLARTGADERLFERS